jgi:hypothetical protein
VQAASSAGLAAPRPPAGLLLLPFLQSDAANTMEAAYGSASTLASREGTALQLTQGGRLVLASLATGTVLWSPELRATPRPGGPHQLQLGASGELQLRSAGVVTWAAGTGGRARGPVRLTLKGPELALADLATNRTLWVAPVQCGRFGGIQLRAYGQCGGAAPAAEAGIRAAVHAADAPYSGACCPTGFQCSRESSRRWSCEQRTPLDRCSGPRSLELSAPCGGLNLCGLDSACSGLCCREGSYCQRSSAFTWSCAPTARFAGGLVDLPLAD